MSVVRPASLMSKAHSSSSWGTPRQPQHTAFRQTNPKQRSPQALQDRVFEKLFDQAEIAKYTPQDRREYEESLKNYWDYFSAIQTSEDKGVRKEKESTVYRLKEMGLTVEQIAQGAGLGKDDVLKIIGGKDE